MPPTAPRLVDTYPSHRTRPMKVLCLGQSRTGTFGLYLSLNKLGFHCWHLYESFMFRTLRDLPLWVEALDLKKDRVGALGELREYPGDPATKPAPWGRKEFDVLLGDYDALADNPAVSFVEELLEAYPDTKVILTLRDVDAWDKSFINSAGVVNSWPSWSWVAPWDKATAGPWWEFNKALMGNRDYSLGGPVKEAFLNHYAHVRRVVPPERLLEFDVRDGWEPLCKFLDKPIPAEPYPHVNEGKDFIKLHSVMWWMAVGKMVLKVGSVVAVPAAGWLYWTRYHRR